MPLVLLSPCSNQPHPFYLADSTHSKFLTSYWFLILVEMVFIRNNCNLTYLGFPGLKIACLGRCCLPGLAAVSQITIKHTWKGVFHLRRSTRCLLPFLGFTYWCRKKILISNYLWPKMSLARSHPPCPCSSTWQHPAHLFVVLRTPLSLVHCRLHQALILHLSFHYPILGFPLNFNIIFSRDQIHSWVSGDSQKSLIFFSPFISNFNFFPLLGL